MGGDEVHQNRVSPEEYLQAETFADVRHEYEDGVASLVGATGARRELIATNIFGELSAVLAGRPCTAFNSAVKVRIRNGERVAFRYPDAMVVCEPNEPEDGFQDAPVVLVEVASAANPSAGNVERWRAYQSICTLRAYVIAESERMEVVCCSRVGDSTAWSIDRYKDRNRDFPLRAICCVLSMGAIYAGSGL